MKKFILSILLIVISITVLVAEDKVPEFDGCYIKLSSGEFVEMKLQKARETYIKGTSFNNFMEPSQQVFYVTDKHNITSVKSDEMVGIAWKDAKVFNFQDRVSLHPLVKKTKAECILPNNISVVYAAGRSLELRRKSLGKETYYFKPRNKLSDGEYVVWFGRRFYLFRVGSVSQKEFRKSRSLSSSRKTFDSTEKISNGKIETYYAKISQRDHYGARNQRLKDVGTILQQDRANYHKYHRREKEDTDDSFFNSRSNRSKMGSLLSRGSISQNTRDAIRYSTPLVKVEIYREYIDVTLESEDGKVRQRQHRTTSKQKTSVPVMIGGEHNMDACGGAMGIVKGISRRGDGFLAVRSGPGTKYKTIDKFYRNGEKVIICDRKGKWIGIVYGKNCGTGAPIAQRKSYDGSCKSGWAFEKYVRVDNSLRNQNDLKKTEQGSGSLTSSEKRSLIKQLLSAPDKQIKSYVKVNIRDFLEKGDHFDPIHKSYEKYNHTCTQIYPNKYKCKFGAYSNFKDTGDEAATVVKYDAVKKTGIVKVVKIYPVIMAD